MKRIVSILMIFTLLFALVSCGDGGDSEIAGVGSSPLYGVRPTEGRDVRYAKISVSGYGAIILLLERATAPKTVDNFLSLANSGFYDGLTFIRAQSGFVIQGGDPNYNGGNKVTETIEGEFILNGHYNDLPHKRGVISMARSNSYNSASSQFFICLADAGASLDYQYAGFGYVILGMSVVDAIMSDSAPYTKDEMGFLDPSHQIKIKSIRGISESEALSYFDSAEEN